MKKNAKSVCFFFISMDKKKTKCDCQPILFKNKLFLSLNFFTNEINDKSLK